MARWAVVGLFVVACPALALRDAAVTARNVAREQTVYRGAAAWLSEKARGGYVFNAEWDAYQELRYFGGTFSVAQGQDPLFVAAYDKERYRQISDAAAVGDPPGHIHLDRVLQPHFQKPSSICSQDRIDSRNASASDGFQVPNR
jgi:hypothetical protein